MNAAAPPPRLTDAQDGLRVVLVDQGPGHTEFLWMDGTVAPESAFHARQSAHELFARIVSAAARRREFDRTRAVRCGRWLLVETPLDGHDDVGRPLAVTLAAHVGGGFLRDRTAGFGELAEAVLHGNGLPAPMRPLPVVLDRAEWVTRGRLSRLLGRLARLFARPPAPEPLSGSAMLLERNTMTPRPQLNQRLVVLTRDAYNQARITSPRLLADPLTTVVPFPLRPPWTGLDGLAPIGADLRPGAIFVRNRFDGDRYVETGGAYEAISLAKFREFARICQLLGARSLEVEELREYAATGQRVAVAYLRAGIADVSGAGGSANFQRIAQRFHSVWEYQTGVRDQEQAEQVAARSGLRADPMIGGLLDGRRYTANPLTRHEVLLDISSEAQKEITFALGLETLLIGVDAGFGGKFDQLRGQSQQMQLKVQVDFGEA
ncbi:hypothetical protein [Yinghuangia seranimata]|uniref:hypothetical protein n=1 Tax=Yinghuangia seranimata TaxID=408067 RepID=UPI00248BC706|nr:hypothetical protein [Yinghuangia seranimata]MDI2125777.1 hypothetical protein [Yinghuangia seranimata]